MAECPVIRFLEPPVNLDGYDRSMSVTKQSIFIPNVLADAIQVREDVFGREQGCSILMEVDPDDARSWHWVVYDKLPGQNEMSPAGTIRLVPYPHDPHPLPGSSWGFDPEAESAIMVCKEMPYSIDRATTYHDGKEPYLKLGRWAVRKEFRGRGLASILVKTAFAWAQKNARLFSLRSDVVVFDKHGNAVGNDQKTWRGLVCIHAQEQVAPVWAKLGFKLDDEMGKWDEAGISHVGMFQRLALD